MHQGIPSLCTGTPSDNCDLIGATNTVTAAQLYGCTGSGAFISSIYCPTALANQVIVTNPFGTYPTPILSFGHTGTCGTPGSWAGQCADQIGDPFGAANAIGSPSPKGDIFCWGSTQWHQLGYDYTAAPRSDGFCMYFGQTIAGGPPPPPPTGVVAPCIACIMAYGPAEPTPYFQNGTR
jgi:hypothetical protein